MKAKAKTKQNFFNNKQISNEAVPILIADCNLHTAASFSSLCQHDSIYLV